MKGRYKIGIGVLAALAMLAGYNLGQILRGPQPPSSTDLPVLANHETLLGEKRPDFILPDLQNQPRHISEWDGKTLLINFWASWCAPCRHEIPAFLKIRDRYHTQGFEIIGIAIDQPDMVNELATELGIDYPLLYGQQEATEISRRFGNRRGTLPYSIFIDSQGIIRHIHAQGELTVPELDTIIGKLLPSSLN